MVRYITTRVSLDGTNAQDVDLTAGGPIASLTVWSSTTSTTLQVRPGSQGDYVDLLNGDAMNFSEPGRNIEPMKLRLNAAAALTVFVVAGYP